jgi:hypothetical protein
MTTLELRPAAIAVATKAATRWCLVAIVAVVLAACSASKDFDLAHAAVAQFRTLMTEQKFDQIYLEAADELKKTTTQPNFTRLLSAVERKLGPVKTAKANGWSVNYNSSGTSVTLKFNTEFEKGTGAETFTYRIRGDKALLAGYNINSDDLIAN